MRCYIWGTNNCEDRALERRGVACFVIPDWGLQFRAVQEGTALICESAALLALLRFVENNPRVFEGQRLEVMTDASQLVDLLKDGSSSDATLQKAVAAIRVLRDRLKFELVWIPPDQNRAINGVLDLPPLQTKLPIEQSSGSKRPPEPHPRRFNT